MYLDRPRAEEKSIYMKNYRRGKKDRTKDFTDRTGTVHDADAKELVERSKNHAIMNIDVLSFERLAFRVFLMNWENVSDTDLEAKEKSL